jgi:phosphoribosylformylglycinamidine synthase subunit PurL
MDKHIVEEHGLTTDEYDRIVGALGREPNMTELGIFSVMWSEHCSYKSSKAFLRTFPTTGDQVIQGPGENAGIIEFTDDLALVFKMESHNHPSFIEPYQGAATGVGGILRDVFTMGARPIANLNALRFGAVDHPKTAHLVSGVVAGIGGYGNCMGIPTVGGEVSFDPCFNGNILVNAFTIGVVDRKKIFYGTASGVGNPVIYVGSKTGRDGIHGATMASAGFGEGNEARRPTVQVGDPFTEKLLLEACLEAMQSDAILGIQDMGAAGLSSSAFEMASRSGSGVALDLDRVPRREVGMTAYDLMLSESQERMLMVVTKGREQEILDIFDKWDLDAHVVGKVTDTGRMQAMDQGQQVIDIPIAPVVHEAPVYERPRQRPAWQDDVQTFDAATISQPSNYNDTLQQLLASPNLSSRAWVYHQYDHQVGTGSMVLPGSDAAVMRVKGTNRGVAISSDCNSRYCYLDPYWGAAHAVAEAARNVACSGAQPQAITDCLNFGNPEDPAIMWQFEQAVNGMAEACRQFNTPVVSGNVSLYNETHGQGIYPTPMVGMVGILKDIKHHCQQAFVNDGDCIVLLGDPAGQLGGSEYLSAIHGKVAGTPPPLDFARAAGLHCRHRSRHCEFGP